MRISDWSSDVCSSDLTGGVGADVFVLRAADAAESLALADLISDFEVGTDSFGFADGLAVEDLAITATASGDAALVLQSSGAALAVLQGVSAAARSEERRVGKGGVSKCRSRWSPYH